MKNQLINNFPKKDKPRASQIEVVNKIEQAIKDGTKFIVCQCPTGSGKSHISATLANSTQPPTNNYEHLVDNNKIFAINEYGEYTYEKEALRECPFGSIVLTTTKHLQNQYETLFDNNDILKGRSNYRCEVDNDFDCELAPCVVASNLKKQCQEDHICPYYTAREDALKSKFAVLNYSMFLTLPDHARRREIIICDEASELEDELVNYYSVTINYDRLAQEGINIKKLLSEDSQKVQCWINDLIYNIEGTLKRYLNNSANKKKSKRYVMSERLKYKYLKNIHDSLKIVNEYFNSCEYVIEKDIEQVTFVPLYVDKLTKGIFSNADTVVLMSATIIDHKTFTKTLGIKDYKYIEVESTFDPAMSPVYCPGKYNLSYKYIDKNLPKVVKQSMQVCDHYSNDSGIIHTHNFKITQAIKNVVKGKKRFLFREAGSTNEKILKEHFIRKDGTVLVSPSLGFGTDLTDESGRFQVIMKLPYLPLGSKRVKILAEKDYNWYIMKMFINLVQMSGRCTRHDTDRSDTFILDGQAFDIIKKNFAKLPKHFRDRLK